jgi:hypothetical protein
MTRRQITQRNTHDSYTFKGYHLMTNGFAHTTYLTIETLGKNDPEFIGPFLFYKARQGFGA